MSLIYFLLRLTAIIKMRHFILEECYSLFLALTLKFLTTYGNINSFYHSYKIWFCHFPWRCMFSCRLFTYTENSNLDGDSVRWYLLSLGYISLVVLKNSECKLSFMLVHQSLHVGRNPTLQIFRSSHLWFLCFKIPGRSLCLKAFVL